MKKKTLSALVLATSLLVAGCGSSNYTKVEDGKYVLFTVNGTNYYADDLLGANDGNVDLSFLDTTAGVKAAYQAIWNAVVQASQPVTTTIQNSADLAYDSWESDTVATYATNYSVSTRQARAAVLESKGYETVEDKKAALLLAEQETALIKSYKKNKIEPADLTVLDNSTILEKYVNKATPMILSHILVSISDSTNVYTGGTITQTESEKLGSICNRLALSNNSSNKFTAVATKSDDGSYSSGGNLGIMDTYTSYVSEFKYGTYVAQTVLNHNSASFNEALYGLTSEESDPLFGSDGIYANYSINKISVDQVCSSLVNDSTDVGVQDPTATSEDTSKYIRNIVFNQYFNTPAVQFLTISDSASTTDYPTEYRSMNADKIVTDDSGNPIIVVRSTYGIHFITVGYDSALHTSSENTTYFSYQNSTSAVSETNNYVKGTNYLGYDTLADAQTARKSEVETRVLNYANGGYVGLTASDSYLSYEMFSYYLNQSGITIPNSVIKTAVSNYLSNLTGALEDTINSYEKSNWSAYIDQLEYDASVRSYLYK
ncbi:MAG: hypothetical protein PHF91_01460 [Bacilli bacterium]|nr:hypothetical protein [Bacilli bacterium]